MSDEPAGTDIVAIVEGKDRKIGKLEARVKRLEAALKQAKETIKAWHGPVMWDIYDARSPKMKQINAAIADAEETDG